MGCCPGADGNAFLAERPHQTTKDTQAFSQKETGDIIDAVGEKLGIFDRLEIFVAAHCWHREHKPSGQPSKLKPDQRPTEQDWRDAAVSAYQRYCKDHNTIPQYMLDVHKELVEA